MEQKIQVLLDQDTTELFDLCSIVNQEIVHGISNFVKMPCGRCGTKSLHSIDLSASSFFRT